MTVQFPKLDFAEFDTDAKSTRRISLPVLAGLVAGVEAILTLVIGIALCAFYVCADANDTFTAYSLALIIAVQLQIFAIARKGLYDVPALRQPLADIGDIQRLNHDAEECRQQHG